MPRTPSAPRPLHDVVCQGRTLTVNIKGHRNIDPMRATTTLRRQAWVTDAVLQLNDGRKSGRWLRVTLAEPVTSVSDALRRVNEALGLSPMGSSPVVCKDDQVAQADQSWHLKEFTVQIISGLSCNVALDVSGWTEFEAHYFMRRLGQLNWVVTDSLKYNRTCGLITFTYDWPHKQAGSKLCAMWIDVLICFAFDVDVIVPDDEGKIAA